MKLLILFSTCVTIVLGEIEPSFRSIPNSGNVRNIPITALEETESYIYSDLKCTPKSKLSKVIEKIQSFGNRTCNGFTFSNEQYLYYGVMSAKPVFLKIDELTVITAAVNGNQIRLICGYLTEGQCNKDYLFSVQIYKADDQNGCEQEGIDSQTAVFYSLWIYGKCKSHCSLGTATIKHSSAIINKYALDV